MSYWTSPDGIQGTALENVGAETKKCGCGCRESFVEDQTFRHEDGEIIAIAHEDAYNEMLEKERTENE